MTTAAALRERLVPIVSRRHVLTGERATLRYRRAFRGGVGRALAVVRPGTLLELWRTLKICIASDVAIILQAANTGLTGGSTPGPDDAPRAVIVNTMRLDRLHLLDGGHQVIALPGVTLHRLERALRPLGREPHSVIGSSCFGASVIGGVCNNSGGALVRRGPAYTELSLYARVDEAGELVLVNQLGVALGDDPETMLDRLDRGRFDASPSPHAASDPDYATHVRQVDAPTPARFNADARRLHGASGSAGKLAVFAVRLDTFPRVPQTASLYIGSDDPDEFAALRRGLLTQPGALPISAEYLHRDTFDMADRYGRDTFYLIRRLGTDRLPWLFAAKARLDGLLAPLAGDHASDRLLQRLSRLLPDPLPPLMRRWRQRFEHHLILTVDNSDLAATREIVETAIRSGSYFHSTPDEAARAALHRFVAAGAAMRLSVTANGRLGGLVALDVALPRNATTWVGALPDDLRDQVAVTMRYGHFLCHVFHRDYLLAPGADVARVKQRLLQCLDREGAEYPAEHNVGRHYAAKPALADFYRRLDPTHRFNPGIGATSPCRDGYRHDQGELI